MDYCLKRVSPLHPQENPEVREYGFGARSGGDERTGGEDSSHRIERAMGNEYGGMQASRVG